MIIIYSVSLNFTNLSPLLFSSSFFLIHLAHHSHLMASATSCPSIPCFLSILLLLLTSTHVAAQAQSSPPTPQQTPNSQYGYFNQSSFNPSMAIVIIVLIAIFFFLGFFSIYVRQCAGEGITGTGPNTQLPTAIRRPKGLDPEIIESLPTMVYSEVKEHKIGKGALECAVCLSEFEDDETLRLLPKCSHVFHHDCIDAWFAGHATCPVCRYNLSDYKKGDIPSLDTMTADSQNPPPETATEITRQAEDRPVDPPSLPTDAVVLEVRPETEAERTEREEAEELERIASRRRALRSKSSRRPVRFPRSHSTGHSLSSNNESNTERYTLRIPDHVLRQIIADGKLKRTTSLFFFGESAGEGSCRPAAANRTPGGEGSSRGGRSGSVRMFVRNLSERFSAWGMGRKLGEGEDGSLKGNGGSFKGGRLGGVRVPFDCLAGGEKEVAESGRGMAER